MYKADDYEELLREMDIFEITEKIKELNLEHRYWVLSSIQMWYEKDKKYDFSNVIDYKARRKKILKRKGIRGCET